MTSEREFQRVVKEALDTIRSVDSRSLQEHNIESRENSALPLHCIAIYCLELKRKALLGDAPAQKGIDCARQCETHRFEQLCCLVSKLFIDAHSVVGH